MLVLGHGHGGLPSCSQSLYHLLWQSHSLFVQNIGPACIEKHPLQPVVPNGITVYLNLPSSVLKVVRNEEASSSCWCQYPFLQSQTVITHASASKWAMSSGVLKWYGSLMVALFKFVGSKQILSFKLPDLSLSFYKNKAIDPSCGFLYRLQHSHL